MACVGGREQPESPMMTFFATLLLVFAPLTDGPVVRQMSDVMIDRTFDVRPGGLLDMDVNHSDLVVRTSESNKARVIVRLGGRNMSKARDWFERMQFQVYESSDGIVIRAEQPERNWISRKTGGARIEVEIHLPRDYNIVARTSHGDVSVGDLVGRLDVKTSHGDVALGRLDGASIEIQSSHGDIDAYRMAAATIRLSTSHADIHVEEMNARTIDARTSHGNVVLGRTEGDANIRSSHGRIQIGLDKDANAELRTSHGDILIEADRDLNAELDLKGASARISSSLMFDGEVEKDRILGRVGNGASRIVATTSHGSVTLKTEW